MSGNILIIEDDPDVRFSAEFILEEGGYQVHQAECPLQALHRLEQGEVFDLILLDMNFSLDTTQGDEGLNFLNQPVVRNSTTPVVAMTGWANIELAIKTMQAGASDFLEKPWTYDKLLNCVKQQFTVGKKKKGQVDSDKESYEWRSNTMLKAIALLRKVAKSDASILLLGENGTGKTFLATKVHKLSSRADNPLVTLNMGAIPFDLFESELFGHRKGAFTGASQTRAGKFELAKGGTLFLDEIANTPLSHQNKLLRVLETGEFEAVGSNDTLSADARVISATNANFNELIEKGEFRQDLFYRLNTITVTIPPLRACQADIIPLAYYFLSLYCEKYERTMMRFSDKVEALLKAYYWPGNVRELSHMMERFSLVVDGTEITEQDLPESVSKVPVQLEPQWDVESLPTLKDSEERLIARALELNHGNTKKAAEALGLTLSAMYRRLDKMNHGASDAQS
ncbi:MULTISPECIES: sigma-54 dependent transcriptional regulator [unclassified Pseudoalteromonas]|uniref:sigma-54-dependent transcriptional regulator n=1 Tax=unclassified Pseudoalteromonas TaxID=194690 RepID=UPI002096AEC9|nr:sigma-54 dependent transcriptional regulator [Pseudoalteromonas sp. XMcav2-N]MCO7191010.1 sigma-54 dependent transcriptional regulator [Pseudoalteromonas sp. XMcav2-N]